MHQSQYRSQNIPELVKSRLSPNTIVSGNYVPDYAVSVKDVKRIEQLQGKYKNYRDRDFKSQIHTVPGPKDFLNRELVEQHNVITKKKFDLKARDNQAFVSNIDDRFNGCEYKKSHPSHKKEEQKLDPSHHRKGYQMKQFILREKWDFLNPEKPCDGKI